TDRAIMIGCTVGQSISILVYILVFQYVLAYQLGWFPVQGWGISFAENLLRYSVLAIIVGVAVSLAPDIRLYRSFFLDEINQDYVRTARAKGLSENRVMWVHVLRNAAIPIVTNILLQLPGLRAAGLPRARGAARREFRRCGRGSATGRARGLRHRRSARRRPGRDRKRAGRHLGERDARCHSRVRRRQVGPGRPEEGGERDRDFAVRGPGRGCA